MHELKKIKIRCNGQTVDAFLLGVYTREFYYFKKTFSFLKRNRKTITEERKTYLVFIPWKHRMKELNEIGESDVVSSDELFPSEWISVPEYVSAGTGDYKPCMPIKDFIGYPFICQNNFFICDTICRENDTPLDILYSELPELLDAEFDEDNRR